MSLDDQYGVSVMPAYLNDFEREVPSRSRCQMQTDGDGFGAFAISSVHRLPISLFLNTLFTYLWVVSDDGMILIALEEAVKRADNAVSIPMLNGLRLDLATEWSKQGHPSLVAGGPARIGGELYFDEYGEPPVWILNSRSGRYGANLGRTRAHLENVAAVLINAGVNVLVEDRFL